jgi:5-hydroxyisourate hydrolase
MSKITTHILDAATGTPAAGVAVMLLDQDGLIATGQTNANGRVESIGPDELPAGTYALVFDTSAYFRGSGTETFYPRVTIEFYLTDTDSHYHVPLLLSPFGYSTYRGS